LKEKKNQLALEGKAGLQGVFLFSILPLNEQEYLNIRLFYGRTLSKGKKTYNFISGLMAASPSRIVPDQNPLPHHRLQNLNNIKAVTINEQVNLGRKSLSLYTIKTE